MNRLLCPKCGSSVFQICRAEDESPECYCVICSWEPYRRAPTESEVQWAENHYVIHSRNRAKLIPEWQLRELPTWVLMARWGVQRTAIVERRQSVLGVRQGKEEDI